MYGQDSESPTTKSTGLRTEDFGKMKTTIKNIKYCIYLFMKDIYSEHIYG